VPVTGCSFKLVHHDNREQCFVIKHENRNPFYLQAENEQTKFMWLEALEKASKGAVGPQEVDLEEYYEILGLNIDEEPDRGKIHRSD